LTDAGLKVSLDHLGEDTLDLEQASRTRDAYVTLLQELAREDLARHAEVSVKLSAIGQALPDDGQHVALENAQAICQAAKEAGTTVTLDMEDHTTTDSTLATLADLRADFPSTGAVLQAYLRRTVGDCRDLATVGSRVRLCKGAYDEPASVAYTERDEIDKSYVRSMRVLMAGRGYPMIATHDPRLIAVAGALAIRYGRRSSSFEYQMLHGVRPAEQLRLAGQGETVRVYLPYGQEWYGYLVRRMAEKPANVGLFVRSLVSRG
jgi:proline dehydrogenase